MSDGELEYRLMQDDIDSFLLWAAATGRGRGRRERRMETGVQLQAAGTKERYGHAFRFTSSFFPGPR